MSRIRLLLVGMLLIFMVGGSAPVGAAVWSEDFNNIYQYNTLTFGDGVNNLNIQWGTYGSGVGYILGPLNSGSLPGNSDAYIDNVGSGIDINTFDAEPGLWHDLHDSFVAGQWVALKGLNDYYGVLHITSFFYGSPGPPPNISGTWYFQDEQNNSYFGSAVPVPGAIWLLFSGLIGLVSFKKKFSK